MGTFSGPSVPVARSAAAPVSVPSSGGTGGSDASADAWSWTVSDVYTFIVRSMVECRASDCAAFGEMPDLTMFVMNVCRRAWKSA
ncbi:MAG: hypothetical protein ACK4RK_20265 [Gemmataceae bacterium]